MFAVCRQLDSVERSSIISSVKAAHGDVYGEIPCSPPFSSAEEGRGSNRSNGGALREGGAPRLLSAESCGLLAQYAAVGLMMGTLPSTITPFLSYYLNMEGQATTSARALLGIPWSLKVFIGILSDCFPIFGYRRRPYMIVGWILCSICLLAMAMLPVGSPYFPDASWRALKPSQYTEAEMAAINHQAPATGGKYIVFMMLATLGYLIADVAADGVVVEYAQREPLAIRGRTQTAIYTVRSLFNIFGSVLVGFGLSSPAYGGHFDFGISFPVCMLLLAVCCAPAIPLTWFFVRESSMMAPNVKQYIGRLWVALQSRAVYQIIAYSFFSGVFGGISYVASDPVTMYWARASSFNISVSQIIGSGVTVLTLAFMGRHGLHWDWRRVTVITTLAVIAVDSVCTMLTTWDVIRSQWFWLGLPIVETVPASVSFIIATFVVVELADKGNEAAIYGLLTTVGNLSNPFSATITKAVNEPFEVSNNDIMNDSFVTRRDVTITVLISYASKLFSLVFLVWLPRQKAQTQALKRSDQKSKLLGIVTVAYCSFALVWSILINLLGIFDSTRCLKIVGGC
ncbi:hypothetical protein BBJ28_00004651 [Nothophytophthora sp. Chile5]|nr:hypothetical protein BBJ28_00004651 [Nothophytophthora sp. Chile5]